MVSGVLARRGYVGLTLGTASSGSGGLPIRSVMPASSAEKAGVLPGDVLTHLDRNPTTDVVEVRRLLRSLRAGDPLLLDVTRDGQAMYFETQVEALPREEHPGASVELGKVEVGPHALRSILVVPEGRGPHPVVYFLPGAHWASDEYPLQPEHPVPALLGHLAREGFASVRVERSGLGDSEGPPCVRVDYETELAGYRAGLRDVLAKKWADPDRIFVFCHSLGAMIAPLLASEGRLAGIACYAASALPISEALAVALVRHAERSAPGDKSFRQRAERIGELVRLVVAGGLTPRAVFAARPDLAAIAPSHFSEDQAYHRIAAFYHQLERTDLAAAWRAFRAPVSFMYGERDWMCTAEDAESLARIVGANAEVEPVPGADHQMSDAPDGAPLRLSEPLRDALLSWLQRGGVGSTTISQRP
jgi:pimeloyl-ACP methyl ester carboxylesterase